VGLWSGQNINQAPNAWDIIAGAPGNTAGNNPWQWNIFFGDQNDVDTTHPYYRNYYGGFRRWPLFHLISPELAMPPARSLKRLASCRQK
jgi:hypothetical protein